MTRQGAKAERDRRHAVETAKADKAKRATTVVEAMFDKDVCRATGRTLEGAAPLVFQAMCRREGIRVYFTHAKRATTVVEAMFDKDVCRATGRTLEGAAPLVFQAMCRREGIRVYFTHAPMTDGQVSS